MLFPGMYSLPLNPTLTTIAPPTPDGGWLDKQNLSQIARSLEEELLLCSADSRLVASSLLWAVSHRFLIQESDILRRKEKELAWGHTVSRRNEFPHNFQRSSIRRNARMTLSTTSTCSFKPRFTAYTLYYVSCSNSASRFSSYNDISQSIEDSRGRRTGQGRRGSYVFVLLLGVAFSHPPKTFL
jgi:hypothetical protein